LKLSVSFNSFLSPKFVQTLGLQIFPCEANVKLTESNSTCISIGYTTTVVTWQDIRKALDLKPDTSGKFLQEKSSFITILEPTTSPILPTSPNPNAKRIAQHKPQLHAKSSKQDNHENKRVTLNKYQARND